ncbi:flavin reductase [Frankia sp. CcI49]|uniref:flavin reductase n=1 Tax=unclassified Frankia TaxID=2632575 RepID=UPI0006CA4B7C|nr:MULTISPECIES: flavin reductase [unclassified Frankia]KPM56579.1 flavin reductase [Frankia sp. R43]ONH62595.1 flavin reductase [Frankia sp. CcI49]
MSTTPNPRPGTPNPAADAAWFRRVLGTFPTGVAVVTGMAADGQPVGMAVGSFTSASLDPPLVAFFPDRSSTSWPRIQASGRFCVNVLGSDQEAVCRAFAARGGDKFANLSWQRAPSGSPLLDGVVAFIDCEIEAVHSAGDHWIVIGRVRHLDVGREIAPLVFFQGGYGRFASPSLAAWEGDLAVQLRCADIARPHMEALADALGAECVASAAVGQELVLVANAGGTRSHALPTRVGQRIPFLPPLGTAFVAWAPENVQRAWCAQIGSGARPGASEALNATLASVRRHGYAVGRGPGWHVSLLRALMRTDFTDRAQTEARDLIRALPPGWEAPDWEEPAAEASAWEGSAWEGSAGETSNGSSRGEGAGRAAGPREAVETLSAPVFDADGSVVLVLSVIGRDSGWHTGPRAQARQLLATAREVTAALADTPAS